jgi:hypothetical protein
MNSPDTSPVGFSTIITGMLITLVNTGILALTATGVIQWDTPTQVAVNAFAAALINVAVFVGSYLWERKKVTPLAAPKDEDGHELVRKGSGNETLAQTRGKL